MARVCDYFIILIIVGSTRGKIKKYSYVYINGGIAITKFISTHGLEIHIFMENEVRLATAPDGWETEKLYEAVVQFQVGSVFWMWKQHYAMPK